MINFICGRSGAGKDIIAKELLKRYPNLQSIVTYTTRPMRPGEKEGKEYHFCDTEDLSWFRDTDNIVEERVYHTAQGDWYYFTVDNGFFDLAHKSYLVTGSLEMYQSYVDYFGEENINLIYLEVPEKQLLERTINRESSKLNPNYAEVCRRFYADSKDFSEDRLQYFGISKENRIQNTGDLHHTIKQIEQKIYAGTQKFCIKPADKSNDGKTKLLNIIMDFPTPKIIIQETDELDLTEITQLQRKMYKQEEEYDY